MKNEYIYERKGKKGLSLQIKVPYGTGKQRKFKSECVHVYQCESKAVAYEIARKKRDQIIMDIRNNAAMVSHVPTVAELYRTYWEISPYTIKTQERYIPAYRVTVAPLDHRRITEVTAADIQKLIVAYAQNNSERSIKRAHKLWHNIFVTAQMQGLNISDQTLLLLPVSSRQKRRVNNNAVISDEQFFQFLECLLDRKGKRHSTMKLDRDIWFMLMIMLFTGCRPAEALAICSEDIDFENSVLHIVKSIGSTKEQERQIVATKREASFRHFPLFPELEDLLRQLLAYSDTSPLLCDVDKQPYSISKIGKRIYMQATRNHIAFSAYQLRHRFSDRMFAEKVNPVIIRDLMGHASATMSLEYAKATPTQLAETVKGISKK